MGLLRDCADCNKSEQTGGLLRDCTGFVTNLKADGRACTT